MPTYIENSASLAAAATNENVIAGKTYERSNGQRTLKAIAASVLDNAPAADDLTVEVFIGTVPVAKFPAGLDRTTGLYIQAEDYIPVNLPVPAGTGLAVKVVNADGAAAHRARVALSIDGF